MRIVALLLFLTKKRHSQFNTQKSVHLTSNQLFTSITKSHLLNNDNVMLYS